MALGSYFLCRLAALGPFGEKLLALTCGEAQWNIFAGATAKKNRSFASQTKSEWKFCSHGKFGKQISEATVDNSLGEEV